MGGYRGRDGSGQPGHRVAGFSRFFALEGHPPRPDARIQHFRAGVQGAPGGSLGGPGPETPVLGIWVGGLGVPMRWSRSIPVAGWPSESWPWARPCTWRHSQG